MEKHIEIAGFIPCSAADGPGVRSVLFLQGCRRNCPGCHNQALWQHGGGSLRPVSQVVEELLLSCRNRRLTISGGEPLEQPEALECLTSRLAENSFELCLYTSFDAEDVPPGVLGQLRYLKTGPFAQEHTDPPKPFVGSNNQRFYRVRKEGENICLSEI